jgi:hypothetical protein
LRFDRSLRHRLEVEYFSYRRRLRKLIARFDRERPPRTEAVSIAGPTTAEGQFAEWGVQPVSRLRGGGANANG